MMQMICVPDMKKTRKKEDRITCEKKVFIKKAKEKNREEKK